MPLSCSIPREPCARIHAASRAERRREWPIAYEGVRGSQASAVGRIRERGLPMAGNALGEKSYKDLSTPHRWMLLILVSMGSSVIYGPIYLKTVFYDPLMQALGCTNTELNTLVSIYGIAAVVFYFFSGVIADKIRGARFPGLVIWASRCSRSTTPRCLHTARWWSCSSCTPCSPFLFGGAPATSSSV